MFCLESEHILAFSVVLMNSSLTAASPWCIAHSPFLLSCVGCPLFSWCSSICFMAPANTHFYVFTMGLRLYSRCTCLCSTETLHPSSPLKPPSPLCPHSSLHSTPVMPQKNVPSIPPYLPLSFPSLSISSSHQSISPPLSPSQAPAHSLLPLSHPVTLQ